VSSSPTWGPWVPQPPGSPAHCGGHFGDRQHPYSAGGSKFRSEPLATPSQGAFGTLGRHVAALACRPRRARPGQSPSLMWIPTAGEVYSPQKERTHGLLKHSELGAAPAVDVVARAIGQSLGGPAGGWPARVGLRSAGCC